MRRVLITGKNSYIGTAVEAYLLRFQGAYQVETLDMQDESWHNFSFAGYDCVFHVAGIAHVPAGKLTAEQAELYYRVNRDLAVETANKAKQSGVKQFIFMSSAIVYGDSGAIGVEKRIDRNTPPAPLNAYGDSKLQAERALMQLESDVFSVAVVRAPMIYGPGCKGNYPLLVKAARLLPCFPRVHNQRSMLFVGHLTAFVKTLIDQQKGGMFWPQNAEYVNTSEMVQLIANAHGRRLWLVPGFEGIIRIFAKKVRLLNKVFGNLIYDQKLSDAGFEYQLHSLCETIKQTENVKN